MTRGGRASFWRASPPARFRRCRVKTMPSPRKFVPLVLIAVISTVGCRLDMHVQPRYNPLAKSDFFSDQRASRPLVEGTVARGDERADTYFYTDRKSTRLNSSHL